WVHDVVGIRGQRGTAAEGLIRNPDDGDVLDSCAIFERVHIGGVLPWLEVQELRVDAEAEALDVLNPNALHTGPHRSRDSDASVGDIVSKHDGVEHAKVS